MLNDYLIVQKIKKQQSDTLLLNDKKVEKPGICSYAVVIGDSEYPKDTVLLLDENDLRSWNEHDKVIKKDKLIMKFDEVLNG